MQKENQLESCLTSPLAGEDARRAGEGDIKGMSHFTPSSVCSDFVRQTTSPAQGGSHTTNGFTLIELLVVVLIIGILAAVAVPQYQKAVIKSRYSNLKILATAIANAGEVYYMANGAYPRTFDELSIDTPAFVSEFTTSGNPSRKFDWGNCVIYGQFVACTNSQIGMRYRVYFPSVGGGRACDAFQEDTNSVQNQICKTETGRSAPDWEYGYADKNYSAWSYQ